MCVIFKKLPDQTIPEDYIINACVANTDGWGLLVPDGKTSFDMQRYYVKDGNKPDEILKTLEKVKDKTAYLHLRLKSSGGLGIESVHPFKFGGMKDYGWEFYLMHNGTMHEYDTAKSTLPDSYHFGKEVALPLYEAFMTTWGKSNDWENNSPLDDVLFQQAMQKFAGHGSRILLVDNTGMEYIVNKSSGKEYNWGWASNDSYFNLRRQSFRYEKDKIPYYQRPWAKEEPPDYLKQRESKASGTVITLPGLPHSKEGASGQHSTKPKVAQTLSKSGNPGKEDTGQVSEKGDVVTLPVQKLRSRFLNESAAVATFQDLFTWSYEELEELCEVFPDKAALLIMDLLEVAYYEKAFPQKTHGRLFADGK